MARASRPEPCIFCGESPCVCNKLSKPKKAKRAPVSKTDRPKEVEEVAPPRKPKVSALAAMKASAKPATKPTVESVEKIEAQTRAEDDPQFRRAVKELEFMLHPTEKRKYANILATTETLAERKDRWRQSSPSSPSAQSID